MLRAFFAHERGQGLAEYGLILILIAIVIVGILSIVPSDKPCAEGYYWNRREQACAPGYRPSPGR